MTISRRMDCLYARLAAAGYPRHVVDDCLPRWWGDELETEPAWVMTLHTLAQGLDLDLGSLWDEDTPIRRRGYDS